jgi:DNA-binding transcriptional LysR family regulator
MLDGITLDQVRVFSAVAQAGTFRAGAARLRRAQSAVSHAIANLEAQLGVALFDRSGHRPALTPAGRALLEDARSILLKVDFMRARARGVAQGVELELTIVVDTLFPLPPVAAALKEVRDALPSVRLGMAVQPLGGPLQALREQRCDLAILAGEEFLDPRIEFELLQPVPVVAVAAADHPLAAMAANRTVGVEDLTPHLQIVLEDPTRLSEGRDFGVLSPETLRVQAQEAKRALIVAGAGWGRLPLWTVERELAEGRLVTLPIKALGRGGTAHTPAFLAHRMDRVLGPAGTVLRQALHRHAEAALGPTTPRSARARRRK